MAVFAVVRFFPAFVIFPVLMICMAGINCWKSSRASDALRDLETICEDTSKQHRTLSFHVRFESYLLERRSYSSRNVATSNYIEVNFTDDLVDEGNVVIATAPPSELETTDNIPFAVASAVVRSPAERLAELDTLRDMLTDAEYDEKKKEILDSL